MNVTSIANLYSGLQTAATASASSTSSVSSGDRVQRAFGQAASRLDAEKQGTQATISAYGQVQAGFSRVQDAGKTLTKGSSATTAETKAALKSLVAAYNETRAAASTTEPGAASVAANGLARATSSDGLRDDLASLGITRGKDGSLSLDTAKLDAALQADPNAVQEAAANVGGRLQGVATRALDTSGGLASRLNTLQAHADEIDTYRAAVSNLSSTFASSTAQDYSTKGNISSYMSILRL